MKIFDKLFRIWCICRNKLNCINKYELVVDFISEIEQFIDLSYSAQKYKDVVHTSFLLKEILLDETQKEEFQKMDYDAKMYLVL